MATYLFHRCRGDSMETYVDLFEGLKPDEKVREMFRRTFGEKGCRKGDSQRCFKFHKFTFCSGHLGLLKDEDTTRIRDRGGEDRL